MNVFKIQRIVKFHVTLLLEKKQVSFLIYLGILLGISIPVKIN